ATYSYSPVALTSLARGLTGEVSPSGRFPGDIPLADDPEQVLYPFGPGLAWGPHAGDPRRERIPGAPEPPPPPHRRPVDGGSRDHRGPRRRGTRHRSAGARRWTGRPRWQARRPRGDAGADRAAQDRWRVLADQRVGVITNPTGVLRSLRSIVDEMHESDRVEIGGVFGPEHGFRGTAQAGEAEETFIDPRTGITVYDAY